MRIVFFFIAFLCSSFVWAHPGIGIVADSRGVIYYTDLHQVWRLQKGKATVAVPEVHTHELFVDKDDNVFGENLVYDAASDRYSHYLWRYNHDGKLDTVVSVRQAYINPDFSLARDAEGNEYYTKEFLPAADTAHIFLRGKDGVERIFAKGSFKGITWLHPQRDGSVIYVQDNTVYRLDASGNRTRIFKGIANSRPLFAFSGNNQMVWGLWENKGGEILAAVFSDQQVKKIGPAGNLFIVHQSPEHWSPLHGVYDKDDQLWILEGSDKNEVRVVAANRVAREKESGRSGFLIVGVVIVVLLGLWFLIKRKRS